MGYSVCKSYGERKEWISYSKARRVVRKNKGYSPSTTNNINREVIMHKSNEYSVVEKNMPSNEDLPPNNNNNENAS